MNSIISSLSCLSLAHRLSDQRVPCVEVPRCGTATPSSIKIQRLSSGAGFSQASSEVTLCFDDNDLHITHKAYKQSYLTATNYPNCNDPIYNSNVVEFFVAPEMESDPHCYNELDISPSNVMFDAGIYNPNLNYSGIIGSTFTCEGSGIQSSVSYPDEQSWTAEMSVPFSRLNCPYNCPLNRYCGHSTPNNIYRANFYRISELQPTEKCTTSSCEYMAWSPTDVDPPAFHEPTKFGYLVLKL
jgi:hypothetical protein